MITVVPAQAADVEAIVDLMEELDRFYGGTEFEPRAVRIRQAEDALFSSHPSAYVVLAKDGGLVLGLASYSFLWPAVGLTRSLYLKELYVSESSRRTGVGKLLMDQLMNIAEREGCSRLEWTTDRENTLAVKFYEKAGYEVNYGKLMYREQLPK